MLDTSSPASPSFSSLATPCAQQEEGEDAYVSAVDAPLPVGAVPPLGSRAEKCDEFVNRAMQEMGNINICEWLGVSALGCRRKGVHVRVVARRPTDPWLLLARACCMYQP